MNNSNFHSESLTLAPGGLSKMISVEGNSVLITSGTTDGYTTDIALKIDDLGFRSIATGTKISLSDGESFKSIQFLNTGTQERTFHVMALMGDAANYNLALNGAITIEQADSVTINDTTPVKVEQQGVLQVEQQGVVQVSSTDAGRWDGEQVLKTVTLTITAGMITLHLLPTDKDFFITSISISATTEARCELIVSPFFPMGGGSATNLASLHLAGTPDNPDCSEITISYPTPIHIKREATADSLSFCVINLTVLGDGNNFIMSDNFKATATITGLERLV